MWKQMMQRSAQAPDDPGLEDGGEKSTAESIHAESESPSSTGSGEAGPVREESSPPPRVPVSLERFWKLVRFLRGDLEGEGTFGKRFEIRGFFSLCGGRIVDSRHRKHPR